ncbi:helix-turn-helix domain-containing protein [Mycobacteroides chelonae]|uniref:helix-turn-helix domain-containing protein n=1 Tax=Mycobacteroides chelonae TaxID=1774 RepID=UPI00099364FF|nr:helix-turn-helix domain-containing protein [Mycobacteroides chelonae]
MHTVTASCSDMQPHAPDRLLAFDEVAGALHQSTRTVFRLADPGETADPIPTVRIGRKRLVRESDLADWIDRRYTTKPIAAA